MATREHADAAAATADIVAQKRQEMAVLEPLRTSLDPSNVTVGGGAQAVDRDDLIDAAVAVG